MDNEKLKKLLNILTTLEKYPIEVIFLKALILNGINSEQELIDLFNAQKTLSMGTRWNLQNYYRDIKNGFYDINKIPTIFK